jgi:hypothetical protein
LGAFFSPRAKARGEKNRAFRCNLFYRFAVKKDFRYNPLRAPSGSGKIAYAILRPAKTRVM